MVEFMFHSHFSNGHETQEEYKIGTHNLGTPGPGIQDVESETWNPERRTREIDPRARNFNTRDSRTWNPRTWDPESEVCEAKETELVY